MLFDSTSQLQPHIPATQGLSFENIEAHLRNAGVQFLRPILGSALYNKLIDDYRAGSADPAHLELLEYARPPLAQLGFLLYIPFGQVLVSDAGMQTANSDTHRNAAKWQVIKMEQESKAQGFRQLEMLIEFLEENASLYPEWDYPARCGVLIKSAAEFNEVININESRLIYLNLLPHIRREEKRLANIISKALMEELRNQILSGSPAEAMLELEERVIPVIAHLAFRRAIPVMNVTYRGERVDIYHNQFTSEYDPSESPEPNALAFLSRTHRELGEQAEEELLKFLHENAPEYPQFMESDSYVMPEEQVDEDGGFEENTGWAFF